MGLINNQSEFQPSKTAGYKALVSEFGEESVANAILRKWLADEERGPAAFDRLLYRMEWSPVVTLTDHVEDDTILREVA